MSVRRARQEIDSREFADWRAYDRWEPIGPVRTDLNAATIAAAVMNARRTKRSDPLARPDEFMPKFYRPPVRRSARELFEIVKQMNAAFGGDFEAKA